MVPDAGRSHTFHYLLGNLRNYVLMFQALLLFYLLYFTLLLT